MRIFRRANLLGLERLNCQPTVLVLRLNRKHFMFLAATLLEKWVKRDRATRIYPDPERLLLQAVIHMSRMRDPGILMLM